MAASFGVFSEGFGRIDQGVDFAGAGPIPALGKSVVTDVGTAHTIQGYTVPYVIYRLLDGPYRNQYVYVAENFTPQVNVGDHLRHGQSVGTAPGASPYIEVGFNQTAKGWTAYGTPADRNGPAGTRMYRFIQSQIGGTKVSRAPHSKTIYQTKTAHSGGGGGGITGAIGGAAGDVTGALGGAAHDVAAPFESIYGGVSSGVDAIKFLFSVRGLQVIGGGLLVLMGIYLLARQIGLAPTIGPITGAANSVADATTSASNSATNTIGPSSSPQPKPTKVVNQYYLEEPTSQRVKRRAADSAPSNEIPF